MWAIDRLIDEGTLHGFRSRQQCRPSSQNAEEDAARVFREPQ
jgi:hypothetical protein